MRIRLLAVPYDSGWRDYRMGRGPEHLLAGGLAQTLAARGHSVEVERITAAERPPPAETGTTFEVARLLALGVRGAAADGAFPLILAGNCSTSLGTAAGLGAQHTGVVWFDAHGDFNTPDTSPSGFLDGMALATLTGRCWHALSAAIPGFAPVPERQVVHVGGRDFDPPELQLLRASDVTLLPAEAVRAGALGPALALRDRVKRLYVHLDLDALDVEVARANQFAAPGGLTVSEITGVVRSLSAGTPIAAAAVTAYDPSFDAEGRALEAALVLAGAVADCAASGPT